jgi:hypothetical protein
VALDRPGSRLRRGQRCLHQRAADGGRPGQLDAARLAIAALACTLRAARRRTSLRPRARPISSTGRSITTPSSCTRRRCGTSGCSPRPLAARSSPTPPGRPIACRRNGSRSSTATTACSSSSQFNRTVFERSGVSAPVRVVPHIARLPAEQSRRRDAGEEFVFYVVATWTSRKALLDAISAYLEAFTAEDFVRLLIHTTAHDHVAHARLERAVTPHAPGEGETWFTLARALAGRRSAPPITLSTRQLDRDLVHALHAASDCFMLLSHGEGWGLGAFEAGAAGIPVIVTGWGGTLAGGGGSCARTSACPTRRGGHPRAARCSRLGAMPAIHAGIPVRRRHPHGVGDPGISRLRRSGDAQSERPHAGPRRSTRPDARLSRDRTPAPRLR